MRSLSVALLCAVAAAGQSYDLVIQGGKIADGTGGPWVYADVGIRGDRIAAMGRLAHASARRRIDAKGMVVAPGFIDIHSHAAGTVLRNPMLESAVRQGITTLVEGPDGGSPVPLASWLDKLAAAKPALNFAYLAGQGSVRSSVMGLVNRPATGEELARMKDAVGQAMRDGAFGLSTGLFYVPGNFTPVEEVVELARVAAAYGGVHISHMRDEAADVLSSVRETIRIGEEGGLPTQVTHHKIIGKANWGRSRDTLKLIDEARARGVDVTIDQYPYTASHTGSAALFPQWALEGGRTALLERMAAPAQRARLKAEIARRILEDRGAGDPANVQFSRCAFDASLNGKTLAEVTRARGGAATVEDAAETILDIQQKGGCSTIYHAISEDDVVRIMRHPATMIASDGEAPVFGEAWPHPRAYGTFPRVLGRYVRELRVLELEDAIRRMTSFPAARLKLSGRGLLRPGMLADIVVFDERTIAGKSEFSRPHQYAEGVVHVIVNGEAVLSEGKMTGVRPGRVLRRGVE